MIRVAGLVLGLLTLILALSAANVAWSFSVVETLVAVVLIIGFGVAAAGWAIRRDV